MNGSKEIVVEKSTKTHTKVKVQLSSEISDDPKYYEKSIVRRHKGISKYISSTFPCSVGSYGQLNPIIKQLVNQDTNEPDEHNNVGLLRKRCSPRI